MEETKICSICKRELPIECFSKDKHSKDGLEHRCKECNKIRRKKKNLKREEAPYIEGEQWKDVKGYEGLYQVSNYGRVKSLDRYLTVKNKWGEYMISKFEGRLLKPSFDSDGYLVVTLNNRDRGKSKRVNVLVAKTWIPNPENKPIVGHTKTLENGLEDKTANEVWNLRWMTPEENSNYGTLLERNSERVKKEYAEGKRKKVWEGKKRPEHAKKLSIPIVEIKEDAAVVVWDSALICAEKNNYNYPHLINAINGKNHKRGHYYKKSQFFKKSDYEEMLAEQAN